MSASPIVLVGDSYACGVGSSSPDHAYPRVMEAMLGRKVHVIARGRCGFAARGPHVGPIYRGAHYKRARRVPAERSLLILQGSVNDRLHAIPEIADGIRRFLDGVAGSSPIVATGGIYVGNRAELLPRVAEATAQVAVERGFDYFDASHWYPAGDEGAYLADDQQHPNDAGHALIAERFADLVRPRLAELA